MTFSEPDPSDSTKRKTFIVPIDSPFSILSCQATQENTSLPAYTISSETPVTVDEYDCGCPGASPLRQRISSVPYISVTDSLRLTEDSTLQTSDSASHRLTWPTPDHIRNSNLAVSSRPMHLLREPSFNPPPFDETEPPPPILLAPPGYADDTVGDQLSILADYFARLAQNLGERETEDDRRDRVRLSFSPTPGGRISRSTDLPRPGRTA